MGVEQPGGKAHGEHVDVGDAVDAGVTAPGIQRIVIIGAVAGVVEGDIVLILIRNELIFEFRLDGLNMAHIDYGALKGGLAAQLKLVEEAVDAGVHVIDAVIAAGHRGTAVDLVEIVLRVMGGKNSRSRVERGARVVDEMVFERGLEVNAGRAETVRVPAPEVVLGVTGKAGDGSVQVKNAAAHGFMIVALEVGHHGKRR